MSQCFGEKGRVKITHGEISLPMSLLCMVMELKTEREAMGQVLSAVSENNSYFVVGNGGNHQLIGIQFPQKFS